MAMAGLAATASSARAQRSDSPRAMTTPQGAFVGIIKNALDSTPVRSADIRLFFMDSGRVRLGAGGDSSIETFVDTTRSRLGLSDSTGAFAIWRLAAGHYLMNVRRIGYEPTEGIVTIDTTTVLFDFRMTPLSQLLAKVAITENATNSAGRRLDRAGFTNRSRFGMGQYVKQAEIMKRKPQTLQDILNTYGLHESADYMLDRMPLDYEDIRDYPAELVAGIEIYRHNRPIEVSMTRRGPTIMSRGGQSNLMRPMVMIWTYIP
jgi:hypothetical protein